jgi:hypothetical protein
VQALQKLVPVVSTIQGFLARLRQLTSSIDSLLRVKPKGRTVDEIDAEQRQLNLRRHGR